jgi:DNA-binding NtrC family response regulator
MATTKGKILVVDDDMGVLYTARMVLKSHFSTVKTENNPVTAFEMIEKEDFDIVILDMNFRSGATSGAEGIDWLKKMLKIKPDMHVIMNTAYGDIDLAVKAMKEGAVDFISKPWEKEKLIATTSNILNLAKSKKEVKDLKSSKKALLGDLDSEFGEIISKDTAMNAVHSTIRKVAKTDANVLILGENGTGKELIAREIHRKSKRYEEAFIRVDLGAIPATLFESELFGHTKGAFTDAHESKAGRFEIANKGSLFLDEIGNLTLPLQAKMLTAIQSKQINRVGAPQPVPVDIRLICATNRDLYGDVDSGEFRQDLLYRINTVEINVPPLRERPLDIPPLVEHFLHTYAKKYEKDGMTINAKTMESLTSYPWPGNVRELRHAVERAVIMSEGTQLRTDDFILRSSHEAHITRVKNEVVNINDMEKITIQEAIRKNKGNLSKAATELGLGRSTLYRKMKKYGIS